MRQRKISDSSHIHHDFPAILSEGNQTHPQSVQSYAQILYSPNLPVLPVTGFCTLPTEPWLLRFPHLPKQQSVIVEI